MGFLLATDQASHKASVFAEATPGQDDPASGHRQGNDFGLRIPDLWYSAHFINIKNEVINGSGAKNSHRFAIQTIRLPESYKGCPCVSVYFCG